MLIVFYRDGVHMKTLCGRLLIIHLEQRFNIPSTHFCTGLKKTDNEGVWWRLKQFKYSSLGPSAQ